MIVEVINTGSELLLGNGLNTHLPYLGQQLFPLGLRIACQVTVPDGDPIRTALQAALARAQCIFLTGGLGPTTDDLTREITAELLGLPLEENPAVWEAIQARFRRRGTEAPPRNRRQAQVPRGALVLDNPHGTAPGLYIQTGAEESARHIFLLPGPPRELQPMFEELVMPILERLAAAAARPGVRRWLITGMGESKAEALVGEALLAIPGLELGYCARPGAVEIRGIGDPAALEAAAEVVDSRLRDHVAGEGGAPLQELLVERLTAGGRTLATAESCTGGLLASTITDVPGASAVFLQGFVTYANEAKTSALGVPAALIAAHGAVSEPVARAMAQGALDASGADFALSTTGTAGPAGGTPEKPVGTLFIGLAVRGTEPRAVRHFFPTERLTFKELAVQTALDLLRTALSRLAPPPS